MKDEAAKVVEEMNEAIFAADITPEDYIRYLEYIKTPIGDYIKYMGCYIWDSENDYREWINDDEQEPLKAYLLDQMCLITRAVYKSMNAVYDEESKKC